MFRDPSELRQPLAKEAVAVLAGVHMRIADHVRVIVRDRQMCVNLLVFVNPVVDSVVIGTEDYTSIAVLGDIFVSVLQVVPNAKLNSAVIPTDKRQNWWFV
jgi:hypothetical protein